MKVEVILERVIKTLIQRKIKMNTKLFIKKLIAIATMTVTIFTGLNSTAHAGANGQQLAIVVAPHAVNISVTGRNQNGSNVTWTKSGSPEFGITSTGTYKTYTWWWVGSVTIKVTYRGAGTKTCNASVPHFQLGDWYSVACV
jgi:hypothetical protein